MCRQVGGYRAGPTGWLVGKLMISSGRRTALNYRILRNPVAAALWRRAWQHARGDTIEGINLPASREEMVAEILSVFSPPPFP